MAENNTTPYMAKATRTHHELLLRVYKIRNNQELNSHTPHTICDPIVTQR